MLAGLVIAVSLTYSAPAYSVDLLVNNYLPPKHPFQTGLQKPWAADVAKATNGSVNVKMSASRLGSPPKNWQTMIKGIADIVLLANIFQPRRILLPTVAQLPLNSPGAKKTSVALWKSHQKYFAQANEYKGAKLLGSFLLAANHIHSREKPIRSLADLKGYKLRAAPGITTKILKEFEAVPVASGPAKIFSLVSKGVVDGAAVPAHGLRAFRILPYIKFTTVIPGGLTNTSFSFLMNGKKWDSLSKEQQKQIMSVSGMNVSVNAGNAGDKAAAGGLKALQAQGGKLLEPDPALLAKIKEFSQRAEGEWLTAANAKGINGQEALAFFKNQLR
ncbi:MAG: TRAP transporter substrate-binding protein [Rhodospirillales bacterium]|nr:TRAP transporter substrate-binding protein [Rhodospirillales bacterium]